jgi:hypothetical protein
MKIYNVIGFAIFALCAAASALFAPDSLGPWIGMGFGIGASSTFSCNQSQRDS